MADDLIPIQNMIYEIRGHRVMLDSDLAQLYEVETKVLNQSVKRNIRRFPSDFMFQLTDEEWKNQRSQIVTFNRDVRKYKPYAFTEHGILMLSTVLKSERAIEVNIQIMRAFVKLRHYILEQKFSNNRVEEIYKMLMLHIENTDNKFSQQDETINQIVKVLNNLIEQPPKKTRQIGFTAENFEEK